MRRPISTVQFACILFVLAQFCVGAIQVPQPDHLSDKDVIRSQASIIAHLRKEVEELKNR